MTSDDAAGVLLRFEDGARGVLTISQISAGRKNSLNLEVDGSAAALSWYSEDPDRLWIGHRGRPNEIWQRDPALATEDVARLIGYPGGHVEGYPDTFRALFAEVYAAVAEGRQPDEPALPHLRRRARRGGGDRSGGSQFRRAPLGQSRAIGGPTMKMGLLTAPFASTPLEEVADWAAAEGFEMLEVCAWPKGEGVARRYGGVTHIDVEDLSETRASEIVEDLASRGISISGLGYYPNPLHPDPEHAETVRGHIKKVITAAEMLEVPVVNTFIGADASKTQADNWADAKKVWPELVNHAADHGVRIAIENCPMIFSHDEWPSGHNLAHTPSMWRTMFEEFGETVGLNFDPSHLVWQMIDIEAAIDEFGDRFYHLHAKDLEIDQHGSVRARDPLRRDRLAGPPASRVGRGPLGPAVRRPLPGRLRLRVLHRARGPAVGGLGRPGEAGFPAGTRRAGPVRALT